MADVTKLKSSIEGLRQETAKQMVEEFLKESDRIREMNRNALNAEFRAALLGQVFGLIIGLTAIISGALTALQGSEWAGGSIGGGGILGLVAVFVLTRKKPNSEHSDVGPESADGARPSPVDAAGAAEAETVDQPHRLWAFLTGVGSVLEIFPPPERFAAWRHKKRPAESEWASLVREFWDCTRNQQDEIAPSNPSTGQSGEHAP